MAQFVLASIIPRTRGARREDYLLHFLFQCRYGMKSLSAMLDEVPELKRVKNDMVTYLMIA